MTDLDKLLDAYGIVGARAEELRRFARSPFEERGVWVDTSRAPAWWSEYQEVERQARVIKAVHLDAHDGLIQSEAYMRCQFTLGAAVDVEEQVRRAWRARKRSSVRSCRRTARFCSARPACAGTWATRR